MRRYFPVAYIPCSIRIVSSEDQISLQKTKILTDWLIYEGSQVQFDSTFFSDYINSDSNTKIEIDTEQITYDSDQNKLKSENPKISYLDLTSGSINSRV